MICTHCRQPIEPVDGPGKKYSHRHAGSKRIPCYDLYRPEIATPTEDTTMNEPAPDREFSRHVNVELFKDEPPSYEEWAREYNYCSTPDACVDGSCPSHYADAVADHQPFWWHAQSPNGEILANGEHYANESGAINSIEVLFGDDTTMQWAPMYGEDRHYRWLRYGATDRKHQQ